MRHSGKPNFYADREATACALTEHRLDLFDAFEPTDPSPEFVSRR